LGYHYLLIALLTLIDITQLPLLNRPVCCYNIECWSTSNSSVINPYISCLYLYSERFISCCIHCLFIYI